MDFVIADLHFGHRPLVEKYKARPFNSLEEMEEKIISNWNSVVSKHDKVYILGDVAWNTKSFDLLPRLRGSKHVVMGNHDHKADALIRSGVTRVYGALALSKYKAILTHVPIHPQCLDRDGWNVNIHGHLHDGLVGDLSHFAKHGDVIADSRYHCVSCERVDYTPVPIESITHLVRKD